MNRRDATLIAALTLGACTKDSAPSAESAPAAASAAGAVGTGEAAAGEGETLALGRVEATELIDLTKLVNKSPAEVDAVLGEPTETGTDRISCVRFVPERVFFACEEQVRVYAHPSFESVRVEFEDGHAAAIALAGLPGEGPLEPDAALALVGLWLPEQPRHDNPPLNQGEGEVDRYEWGNSRARLRIDGLEHRVRLSVVDGEWRRAKLELINNNPLSPEQAARVKPAKPPG